MEKENEVARTLAREKLLEQMAKTTKRKTRQKKRKLESRDHLQAIKSRAMKWANVIVALDISPLSPAVGVFDYRDVASIRVGLFAFTHLKSHILMTDNEHFNGTKQTELVTKEGHKLHVKMKILRNYSQSLIGPTTVHDEKISLTENEEDKELVESEFDKNPTSEQIQYAIARNEYHTDQMMRWIQECIGKTNKDSETKVMITMENYAFDAIYKSSGTTSLTKEAEICGIMHSKLYKAGLLQIDLVPPTTIKLWFTGNGSSDKFAMWASWKSVFLKPELLPIEKFLRGSFTTNVPHPHQDLVDAFGLGYFLLHIALSNDDSLISLDSKRNIKKAKKRAKSK